MAPSEGISMRRFLYLLTVLVYTGAVFMAGMLVVQLYALYVLVYTGAVFMVGMWIGQRWERAWLNRRKTSEPESLEGSAESHAEADIRKPTELTLR